MLITHRHLAKLTAGDKLFYKALRAIGSENDPEKLLGLVLETGNVNLKCMALLDAANTDAYGDPVPTEVPLTIEKVLYRRERS